ncbi:hypothetical protein [Piscibacillus salipiscarius]|uniref:hypothetical protein n=1 Tax=Piscibacillus salipiscarius TaxID=299480 RepID=UPI002436C47B|nr:hypothetical protein [Piscibacillus salipiscarius]
MSWTREEAFDFLKTIYTDEVMQDEKRRVFKMLNRQLYERLDDLAINNALSDRSEKQLKFLKNLHLCQGIIFFSPCVIYS